MEPETERDRVTTQCAL